MLSIVTYRIISSKHWLNNSSRIGHNPDSLAYLATSLSSNNFYRLVISSLDGGKLETVYINVLLSYSQSLGFMRELSNS